MCSMGSDTVAGLEIIQGSVLLGFGRGCHPGTHWFCISDVQVRMCLRDGGLEVTFGEDTIPKCTCFPLESFPRCVLRVWS